MIKRSEIENEFILGLRKINGINKKEFNDKYNINIKDIEEVKGYVNTIRSIKKSYVNH